MAGQGRRQDNAVFIELGAWEGEFVTSTITGKLLPLLKVMHGGVTRL